MAPNPLLQVSLDLAATLTAEERYGRLIQAVRRMIPADSVIITRLSEDGLHPVAFDGLRDSVAGILVPLDQGPHACLIESGNPIRLSRGDGADLPSFVYADGVLENKSAGVWLGVPLLVDGEPVGTLAMSAVDSTAFDQVADQTVMAFAALTAAALRTVWLLDSLQAERDQLRRHVVFEELVLSISARFINLPPEEIQVGIDEALRQVGEFAGVDRCYIFLSGQGVPESGLAPEVLLQMMHEWVAEGIPTTREQMDRMLAMGEPVEPSVEARDWMLERVQRGEVIRIDSVDELTDANSPMRQRWQAQGCKSLITVPLDFGSQETLGVVGFECDREERRWDDATVNLLRTVGYILASAIERKRSMDALREVHESLESLISERTSALKEKQAQLVQSEKMAALGQLVAGIAHEVNTPLGAIHSNNDTLRRSLQRIRQLLEQDAVNLPRLQKIIGIVDNLSGVSQEATQRIIRIVGSLRNFARLDQAEVEQVDIHEGIESTLTLVNHKLKGRIKVHREFGKIPTVECHANQINQVFMNLFVNAVQAMEKGDLYIRTERKGDEVLVTVRDTGKGIPENDLPKIFDPGFTTKGVGVGTGLGLSIVHQIIEEHRGRVEIESRQGEGTTVRVALPAVHPSH